MRPLLTALLLSTAVPARAEVPTVLADSAPVHSLVSMVMGDLGAPGLIVPPGTSPHHASLTPSEAQALTDADLIVWTGSAFLPWLGDSLASLAPDTPSLALLETGGWDPLPLREDPHLGGHAQEADHEEHDHGEHNHDEHDHDEAEHEEHDHDEVAPAEESHGHSHAEGGIDPHAWLDPEVAAVWLGHVAVALSEADPANAATYNQNAEAAADRLLALRDDLRERLAPLSGRGYAVGHDAYQYLERAAGLPAAWALGDAAGLPPSPGTVASLRDSVIAGEVTCLLLDAETDPAWATTLGEGTTLRTAEVDPDGVHLEPGPDLYPALMESLGTALESCLGG